MLWERGAAVWAPFLLAAGAIAVAGLWGLFEPLSAVARSVAVTLIVLVALGFSVRGLLAVRAPSRRDTLRRLEIDGGLTHQPLSALEDRPALGHAELWDLHKTQAADAARQARVGRPRAGLAAADPFALRYALVIAAVLALWARGPQRAPEAVRAFEPIQQFAAVGGRVFSAAGDKVMAMVGGDGPLQSRAAIPGRPRSLPAASRP
jgi:hypothetical protein